MQVDFLRDAGGVVTQSYTVAAGSRFTVLADVVPGLEAATFGARITSTVPVVVERAMYWAGGYFDYYEGHVAAGTTATAARWLLAEAEIGGANAAETFVLVANTSSADVTASMTLLPEPDEPPLGAPGALLHSGLSPIEPIAPGSGTVPNDGVRTKS